MNKYMDRNRETWNAWTDLHEKSEEYDIASFKKGDCRLHSIERAELTDVAGKSLLHLQCHFGLDTLSWAQRGARVVGVDFSEHSIELAKRISKETGIDAEFICSNIYDLPDVLDEKFDIVFTSYGVLIWLPDMDRWGRVVSHFLKPAGTFFIAEFHPFACVFDDNPGVVEPKIGYPYFHQDEPLRFEGKGSYAAPESDYVSVTHEWSHSMSDIVNALIKAGLTIEHLHEFPYCASKMNDGQVKGEDGWWRMKTLQESIPLSFSIKARK